MWLRRDLSLREPSLNQLEKNLAVRPVFEDEKQSPLRVYFILCLTFRRLSFWSIGAWVSFLVKVEALKYVFLVCLVEVLLSISKVKLSLIFITQGNFINMPSIILSALGLRNPEDIRPKYGPWILDTACVPSSMRCMCHFVREHLSKCMRMLLVRKSLFLPVQIPMLLRIWDSFRWHYNILRFIDSSIYMESMNLSSC